jgi:hypothetical protein
MRDRVFAAAIALARTELRAEDRAVVADVLARGLDWDAFLSFADAHRVGPLAAHQLFSEFRERLPSAVATRMRRMLRDAAVRALTLANVLAETVASIEASAGPVIAYKGPVAGTELYGNPALRAFDDLDILVDPVAYGSAVPAILVRTGWVPDIDYGYERIFARQAGATVHLDLHGALMPDWIHVHLDHASAVSRCRSLVISGREVRVFSPEDLLIVLCVHLAKDVGETGGAPRLVRVCDIAEFCRVYRNIDWDGALAEAKRLGVLRIVHFGLRLCRQLMGIEITEFVGRQDRVGLMLQPLLQHAEERIVGYAERDLSHPDFLDERRWNRALRERLRDRVRPTLATACRRLAPAAPDFAWIRLPPRFQWAYWGVRPMRLATKYARMFVRVGWRKHGQ